MDDKKPRKKHIKYNEGQWFAVSLTNGGYALGIIVRGSYKARGGLGYFFGPRRQEAPHEDATWSLQPRDAVLITWFGDLHIIEGKWPLIASARPFRREEWPVPVFGNIDLGDPNRGWLIEYDQQASGYMETKRATRVRAEEVAGLPEAVLSGAGAVEIVLTRLL